MLRVVWGVSLENSSEVTLTIVSVANDEACLSVDAVSTAGLWTGEIDRRGKVLNRVKFGL